MPQLVLSNTQAHNAGNSKCPALWNEWVHGMLESEQAGPCLCQALSYFRASLAWLSPWHRERVSWSAPSPFYCHQITWPGWDLLLGRQETGSHQQWSLKPLRPTLCWGPGRSWGYAWFWLLNSSQGRALRPSHVKGEGGTEVVISIFMPLIDDFKSLTNIWACIYQCQVFQSLLQQDEAVHIFIFLLPSCFPGFAE